MGAKSVKSLNYTITVGEIRSFLEKYDEQDKMEVMARADNKRIFRILSIEQYGPVNMLRMCEG